MNKTGAIEAMKAGKVLTHTLFTEGEHIYMKGGDIYDEKGYKMSGPGYDFWTDRQDECWNRGWEILEGVSISTMTEETKPANWEEALEQVASELKSPNFSTWQEMKGFYNANNLDLEPFYKKASEMIVPEQSFYCADWNRVGTTCEGQCNTCKKASQLELPDGGANINSLKAQRDELLSALDYVRADLEDMYGNMDDSHSHYSMYETVTNAIAKAKGATNG